MDRQRTVIRTPFLPLLFDWMRTRGEGAIVDEIVRELELPEPTGTIVKELPIALPLYATATARVAERIGEDFLGLRVAESCPRGSFGIVEYAARSAPDVEEALARIVRYLHLLSGTVRVESRKSETEFAISQRVPGEPLCVGRYGNEFTLAMILRLVRETTEQPVQVSRIEFAHPAPPDIEPLTRHFGTTNVTFDAGRNEIAFELSVAKLRVVSSDQGLLPWLDRCARAILPSEVALSKHVPGLREEIRQCLSARATPTLGAVARNMHLSSRTLQRRLRDACTSFQDELEEVRREIAESHLRDPKMSIYEIALLLGYADRSGFERAFMKWYGVTPKEFRRSAEGAPREPSGYEPNAPNRRSPLYAAGGSARHALPTPPVGPEVHAAPGHAATGLGWSEVAAPRART